MRRRWILCTAIFVLLIAGLMAGCTGASNLSASTSENSPQSTTAFEFQYWNESSDSLKSLVSFVESAVDENSPDFIPEEDRIVVSDMDGTLLCETSPFYFEWMMLFYRVLDDPDYEAPAEMRNYIENVLRPAALAGTATEDMHEQLNKYMGEAYSGMTQQQFREFVERFMAQPVENHDNMTYGESFYLPMREVVSYLQENGFTFYIVSGADRETCRVLGENIWGVDSNHIIGKDTQYQATGQGDVSGASYTMTSEDEVVREEVVSENIMMNKVSSIVREIGKQPVLAFGNSSGDYSMLTYTTTDNPYRSAGFMLLCDDLDRDNGNLEKAEGVRSASEQNGWYPVSMRDDFLTIYGDDVVYKKQYAKAA